MAVPIKPENRHRYPPDWQWIRQEILERAGHCCEFCGVADRAWGWRDQWGYFHYTLAALHAPFKPPFVLLAADGERRRIIEIVLTVAHLDHQPENNEAKNLRALCGGCHLNHDRRHHIKNRYGPKPGQLLILEAV